MRAPIFMAATVYGTLLAIADQSIAGTTDPRIADVSLANLNLASADGMRTARDRLQAIAQRVCADAANGRDATEVAV